MDPWRKSELLGRAAKDMGADLVLCGKESLDNQNGQVGAFIAHHLGMPFVSAILGLTIVKNRGLAKVRRSAGRGVREVVECSLPAIFSVDFGFYEPRLPTYEAKKQAQSLPIRKLSYTEEATTHKTISTRIFPPRPRPKKIPSPDSRLEAYDRIRQLLMGSRIEKKGALLKGSPESQAEGIISILQEHGFIESKKVPKKE
jgi:electron transfer flavoprotein beta subunit